MDTIIKEIEENVTSKLHLIQCCSLQIRKYKDKRMFEKAISSAIYILDNLGENLDINPEPSAIQADMLNARNLVNRLTDEQLSELKVLEDGASLSIMNILHEILYSAFLVNKKLFASVSARMTILTFKQGLSKYSAYSFCSFGAVLCGNGDKMGYRCGQLALAMLQKIQAKEAAPLVYGIFYAIISPFYSSIHVTTAPLKLMYHNALLIGNQESVVIGGLTYCMYALLSGTNLASLLDDIEGFRSTMPALSKLFLCVNQAVLNFQESETKNPAVIEGDLFNYQVCYDKNEKGYDISRCLVICIFTACIFNDYNLALKFAIICRPLISYITSFYMEPIFLFYDGLATIIAMHYEQGKEKETLSQHAKENIIKLRKMSEDAPENYLNKVCLLEAELAFVYEDKNKAISSFQRAIELSMKHNFLHEEAITRERAAMYCIQNGLVKQSTQLLLQSFSCYKKWGAIAKLKNLTLRFPTVFKEKGNTLHGFKTLEIDINVENNSMDSVSMLT